MTVPVLPAIGEFGWGPVVNEAITDIAESDLSVGHLSARPSAATAGARALYWADDDNGGTIYRSNGTSWTQLTPGVSSVAKGSVITGTNATGVTTPTGSVINTLVDVPSTGLTVPANTPGDVWLEWQGDFLDGGTTGVGLLCLVETTSGSVLRSSVVAKIVNDASVGSFPQKAFQLGAVTTARSFKLQIEFITAGAQFSMLNSTTNPTYLTVVGR